MGIISIILTILKIAGIVLASLLALVLLVLLLVLFVPLRYRARVCRDEDTEAKAVLSWLLHIVHAAVLYDKDGLLVTVRLFGIKIYDSSKPKRQRKEKKTREEKKNRADKKKAANADARVEEAGDNAGPKMQSEEYDDREFEEFLDRELEKEEKRKGKAESGKKLYEKITGIVEKVKKLYNKIVSVKEKVDDERNRRAVGFLKSSLFKLLKHVMPKSLRGSIDIGFEDPATTGYVLGVLGAVYGLYAGRLKITPYFDEAVFKCDIKARGRVFVISLVVIALKVLFNKDFKYLRKQLEKKDE